MYGDRGVHGKGGLMRWDLRVWDGIYGTRGVWDGMYGMGILRRGVSHRGGVFDGGGYGMEWGCMGRDVWDMFNRAACIERGIWNGIHGLGFTGWYAWNGIHGRQVCRGIVCMRRDVRDGMYGTGRGVRHLRNEHKLRAYGRRHPR